MFTRRNFVYALIAVSIFLIILNISIEVVTKKVDKDTPTFVKKEIENKFALTLNNYGIDSKWIKKVHVKKPLSDSLNYLFNIAIPNEITITTLIKDINNAFINLPVSIETSERKNYSNSVIKIYSDNVLKLQANLNHSDEIEREFAEFSFLVYINTSDSEIPLEMTSKVFYKFTYLIVPTKASNEIKSKLNRNYAILLNDQISDAEYALEEEFTKQKLINNIRTIILTFGKDNLYIIDESSALYNSKIFSLLRDEFESRGIKLKSLQNYNKVEGNNLEQLKSLLSFYATSMKGKEGKTFVVELSNFIQLNPTIEHYIKKGNRVVEVKN
jgi:hypothetical protein